VALDWGWDPEEVYAGASVRTSAGPEGAGVAAWRGYVLVGSVLDSFPENEDLLVDLAND
jgi:hypothetical protein